MAAPVASHSSASPRKSKKEIIHVALLRLVTVQECDASKATLLFQSRPIKTPTSFCGIEKALVTRHFDINQNKYVMKKHCYLLVWPLLPSTNAQNNTFPATGNVGAGNFRPHQTSRLLALRVLKLRSQSTGFDALRHLFVYRHCCFTRLPAINISFRYAGNPNYWPVF